MKSRAARLELVADRPVENTDNNCCPYNKRKEKKLIKCRTRSESTMESGKWKESGEREAAGRGLES